MWDKIGLSKPCKLSLRLRQLWQDQLFDILVIIDGDKLMSSLVVCDGVCMLNGDIRLKSTLAPIASRYIDMVPLSNSFDNMRIIILSAVGPSTYWCIVSVLTSKCVLVTMHINLSTYMLSSNWTWLLSSPWWVCQWVGSYVHAQWHPCSWTPLHAIDNTAHPVYSMPAAEMGLLLVWAQFHQFVHVATPVVPVPATTPSLAYSSPILPWVAASAPITPPFLSMPLRDPPVALSPHRLNLWRCSHHKWICLNLQLCSASTLSTTFLLPLLSTSVLPSAPTDGASHCVVSAISFWYPYLWTTWCIHR